MADDKQETGEEFENLQLPPPQREATDALASHATESLPDTDQDTNTDHDKRTLLAKIKGYQTLGKLYRNERDKNLALSRENLELTARLTEITNTHSLPKADPGLLLDTNPPVPDSLEQPQLALAAEPTSRGDAGHSTASLLPAGAVASPSTQRRDTADWDLGDDMTPTLTSVAEDVTRAYAAMEGPEPDYEMLFSHLETCVQRAAPGVASDLVRLSLHALKRERKERVKQDLLMNMKMRLRDRDKLIKQLRAQLKAGKQEEEQDSPREDWVTVEQENTQHVEELKREHAQEVAALQQELENTRAEASQCRQDNTDRQLLELRDVVDDLQRQLNNEQVASEEWRQALREEEQRSRSAQETHDKLEKRLAALKRQCREDEQIIQALTTQNRSLRVASPSADQASDKLRVEMEVLKQQVTIYKEDFDQERKSREQAHTEKETLEAKYGKLKDDLKRTQKELLRSRQHVKDLEESKKDLLQLKREKCEALRLTQQQLDSLQGRLSKAESERRRWQAAMFTPPAYYMQQAPGPKTWTCGVCTYDNKMGTKSCELCYEKAPAFLLTKNSPLSNWTDNLQTDNGEPLVAPPPVPRAAPLTAGQPSGGAPHPQPNTTDHN